MQMYGTFYGCINNQCPVETTLSFLLLYAGARLSRMPCRCMTTPMASSSSAATSSRASTEAAFSCQK